MHRPLHQQVVVVLCKLHRLELLHYVLRMDWLWERKHVHIMRPGVPQINTLNAGR
jgi:hypothetical protein